VVEGGGRSHRGGEDVIKRNLGPSQVETPGEKGGKGGRLLRGRGEGRKGRGGGSLNWTGDKG